MTDPDVAVAEAARLHEPAPVTRTTEFDRLAAVRPDLAARLASLAEEMRRTAPVADSVQRRPYISFEPGGMLGEEPR
jgi:hypothetical protein